LEPNSRPSFCWPILQAAAAAAAVAFSSDGGTRALNSRAHYVIAATVTAKMVMQMSSTWLMMQRIPNIKPAA
jgi:hypothetical protein